MATGLTYLCIGAGSALGGMGRFWLTGVIGARVGEFFPWGTLVVNITGSFAIGLFIAVTGAGGRLAVTPRFAQFFTVGVCGGYTTFSAFSQQTLKLAQTGQWWHAGANVALSILLCLAGVWLGHWLGQAFNR